TEHQGYHAADEQNDGQRSHGGHRIWLIGAAPARIADSVTTAGRDSTTDVDAHLARS
ncbi:MAG: hypothetical protein ACI83Y_000447, partial [Candidatus Azotimanducaceae bacterium]